MDLQNKFSEIKINFMRETKNELLPASVQNCLIFLLASVILTCTDFFTNSFVKYSLESASEERV